MKQMIIYVLTLFFGAVGLLHFYWAFGGRWGFMVALPQKKTGEYVLIPKMHDCIIVGTLLLACCSLYMTKLGLTINIPNKILNFGFYVMPIIFIARAIGDFNYIGFNKRIKHTDFAKNDTRYFSPLCLIIAILGFIAI